MRSSELAVFRLVRLWVALVLVGPVALAKAANAQNVSEALRGVPTVTVIVENLNQSAAAAGITKERLRTIIELKLRLVGIHVVSPEESFTAKTNIPVVYAQLDIMPVSGQSAFVYNINLSLRRFITSRGVLVATLLWEHEGVSLAGRDRMPNALTDDLTEFVDVFVNDWLAVNPRRE